ncbi:MAG: hypothetical protein CBARDMAM_6018 [uncultured Caballeronia sp.]|nr:MAG: hypothetical protein CBARDMAM_6018 [uncultured Caballeronia sp.]
MSATHFYTGATVHGELRPDIGEQTVVIEMSDGAGTTGVARQSKPGEATLVVEGWRTMKGTSIPRKIWLVRRQANAEPVWKVVSRA